MIDKEEILNQLKEFHKTEILTKENIKQLESMLDAERFANTQLVFAVCEYLNNKFSEYKGKLVKISWDEDKKLGYKKGCEIGIFKEIAKCGNRYDQKFYPKLKAVDLNLKPTNKFIGSTEICSIDHIKSIEVIDPGEFIKRMSDTYFESTFFRNTEETNYNREFGVCLDLEEDEIVFTDENSLFDFLKEHECIICYDKRIKFAFPRFSIVTSPFTNPYFSRNNPKIILRKRK